MARTRLRISVLALSCLAACANPAMNGVDGAIDGGEGRLTGLPCPNSPETPAMPFVNVGPDVSRDLACGSVVEVPIASISNLGGTQLRWDVQIEGPATIFGANTVMGISCPVIGVTIVTAKVSVPNTAVAGDTFDATFTVSAPRGEFAPGTAQVHVRVVAAAFTVMPEEIDFGQIAAQTMSFADVTLRNDSTVLLPLWSTRVPGPFGLDPPMVTIPPGGSAIARARFMPGLPGDYTAEVILRTNQLASGDPGPCAMTKVIKLRGSAIELDGGMNRDASLE
jgi:hypothetical protein